MNGCSRLVVLFRLSRHSVIAEKDPRLEESWPSKAPEDEFGCSKYWSSDVPRPTVGRMGDGWFGKSEFRIPNSGFKRSLPVRYDDPNVAASAVVGIISAILLFVIIVVLQAYFYGAEQSELERKV